MKIIFNQIKKFQEKLLKRKKIVKMKYKSFSCKIPFLKIQITPPKTYAV